MNPLCAWHEGDEPLDAQCEPGCQGCGRLLEWKTCEGCHADFLDWSVRTFDDVISGPAVTSEGDLYCIPCARQHAAAEERQAEEDGYDYDPYEAAGESRSSLPGGGRSL